MISVNLNRRHKTGLFLVLVATGVSLMFEASAKQTAGIVLLGVATTWLFASASLRTLGFAACSLACAVGLFIAVLPVHEQWLSTIETGVEYDSAVAEIRAAVAESVPSGQTKVTLKDGTVLWLKGTNLSAEEVSSRVAAFRAQTSAAPPVKVGDLIEQNGRRYRVTKIDASGKALDATFVEPVPESPKKEPSREYQEGLLQEKRIRVLAPDGSYGTVPESQLQDALDQGFARAPETGAESAKPLEGAARTLEIPTIAMKFMRPDKKGTAWDAYTITLPVEMSEGDIIRAFLVPRPTFSFVAAITSHRAPILGGVVLIAVGLFGFAGMLWRKRKVKESATALHR